MKRWWTLALVGVLLGVAGACGGAGAGGAIADVERQTRATEEGDFTSLVAEAEAHWERRASMEDTQRAIALWEQATRVPEPAGMTRRQALYPVLAKLSRAYYWLADYHYRFYEGADREETQKRLYERGSDYGRTALALNNDAWTNALLMDQSVADAAALLRAEDMDAAYWHAVNISRWGLADGIATVLRLNPDVFALMSRVRDLDANFFYGAPYRYFGAYYTRLPFGAPNLNGARENFERAIAAHPSYLDNRFLFASDWAVTTNSRDVAEEQLRAILAFDLDTAPEIRPENEGAQRKARQMLEELDRFFR